MPTRWLPLLFLVACTAPSTDGADKQDTDASAQDTDIVADTGDTDVVDDLLVTLTEFPDELVDDEVVTLRGQVTGESLAGLRITVTSQIDGPVFLKALDSDGKFAISVPPLSPGVHDLVIAAEAGPLHGSAKIRVSVCSWPALQDFDADPIGMGWQAYGDASWDPGGWMELTGISLDRSGSVYLTDRAVDPGDVRLEFRIATGGGAEGGADGYAVNIIDVPTVEDLEDYIAAAQSGACLGYASGDDCPGLKQALGVSSLHIEFDTWWNPGTDPTMNAHVSVMRNGDHQSHLLWADYAFEDLAWRDVVVETHGERVRVDISRVTVLNDIIPGFKFDGGWIGVSGSTGGATNYHRFDDLQIRDRCVVPE